MRAVLSLLSFVLLLSLSSVAAVERIPVKTVLLAKVIKQEQQDAPAVILSLDSPLIAAEISGRITELPLQAGDTIRAGQLLVAIDCRSPDARKQLSEAQYATAKARLRFAKSQLKRAHELMRRQSISDELLDQRRFELADAKASLARWQADLMLRQLDIDHCHIRAPCDAIISQRLARVGSLASPGMALLKLIRKQPSEVSARLNNDEARALRQALASYFVYQHKSYPLTLRKLSKLVDSRSRTQQVRLRFSDSNPLPIGTPGRLIWHSDQPLISADYLVRRDGRLGIFVRAETTATARFIALPDAREGRPARLPRQLLKKTGLRLITAGRQLLHDGQAIEEKVNDDNEAVKTPA